MQTDFLSHLSARATQETASEPAAGGLRPRPVALFEPPKPSIFPFLDRSPDPGKMEDAQPRTESHPEPVPAASHRTLGLVPSIRPPLADKTPRRPRLKDARVDDTVVHERELSPSKAESVQGVAPAPRQDENLPDVAPPKVDGALRGRNTPPQAATLRPGVVTPSLIGQQAEVWERRVTVDASSPLQTDQPVRRDAVPVPTSESPVKPKIIPEKVSIAPKTIQPAKPEPLPQPDSMPEPLTINVTIGRIEVKATAPSAPPRRAPVASPIMTLDEYLRRRRGGND